jgi:hypothetical protein
MHAIIKSLPLHSKWNLALKTLPFVFGVIIVKLAIHLFGLEFLELNGLFTAVISANIFLIGFLISGVLSDYKESEKVPGDLAASLEALADEGFCYYEAKKSPDAKAYLEHLAIFNRSIIDWFHEREHTRNLLDKLFAFNHFFVAFEGNVQATFIGRMKQEQNFLRKTIHRVHTIRETSFLGTGYAIAEIITGILVLGLLFIAIEPFYESLFFVAFVSFMLIYMIFFIKDLDNPFGYATDDNMVEDVSLHPVQESLKRIEERIRLTIK